MTLRRTGSARRPIEVDLGAAEERGDGWSYNASLRWRLSLLTATLVAFAVGITTVVAYWTVSSAQTVAMDRNLEAKADAMLERSEQPGFYESLEAEIALFRAYEAEVRVAFSPPGWEYVIGDSIALPADLFTDRSDTGTRTLTVGGERILVKHGDTGATVIMAQDTSATYQTITTLGVLLLVVSGVGVLISILIGFRISSAGLRPLIRLQEAVEDIARTDELQPIPVVGNDELARLTVSVNEMLEALRVSRLRQSQLVADAGHELKTPLTSLRTNIELLMLTSRPGAPAISEQDREDLERDVIAQLAEMSTLIGDLVDLAREESVNVLEPVDLNEILATAVERTERRRLGVTVEVRHNDTWFLNGDEFSLTRALVNVLDNAVKWSPEDGVVRVSLKRIDLGHVQITVADSGPGIPEEERPLVFERFYRAVKSRSMPGSGLGLAIVQQVVNRHAGTVAVGDSDDGGTAITMVFPGAPDPGDLRVVQK